MGAKPDYENLRKIIPISGDIILKCTCKDEIRRVPLNQCPTYDELCFMLQRLFKSKLSDNIDDYVLKYRDEDGDMVSIVDDADISVAASQYKVLKVVVYEKMTLQDSTTGIVELSNLSLNSNGHQDIMENLRTIQKALDAIRATLAADEGTSNRKEASIPASSYRPLSQDEMAEFMPKSETNGKVDPSEVKEKSEQTAEQKRPKTSDNYAYPSSSGQPFQAPPQASPQQARAPPMSQSQSHSNPPPPQPYNLQSSVYEGQQRPPTHRFSSQNLPPGTPQASYNAPYSSATPTSAPPSQPAYPTSQSSTPYYPQTAQQPPPYGNQPGASFRSPPPPSGDNYNRYPASANAPSAPSPYYGPGYDSRYGH
ncbi:hypothetical protein BZG36_02457 [Bifiguratus adelaidae]|uniref:PB1 domain-containing protein n=1 Tax=Bifiguratus adelaidae TaxID=1938954 RepID=A0A261Y3S5_9FUNG|nr:hypothetical protein BZG36_02457 [Bifiguratus adelaidae]